MALHDPGYLMLFATLNKTQSPAEAKKTMLEVVEGLRKNPVTEAELRRAKTAMQNEFEKSMSDPTSFGIGLSESVAQGDWRLYFLGRDRIEKATLGDVQKVAENYLVESNRTFGQFIPTDKPLRATVPITPDLTALLANYQGKSAVATGETFEPSPENIDKRTVRVALPNGMKGSLLSKTTRGNTVNGQIVLRMGDEKSLFGKRELAQFVAQLMLRGTAKLSRQQIADRLDELKAKLTIGTPDGNAVTVNFESRREQLADTLKLIRDILRTPTFPQTEFEQFRTEWLTGVQEKRRQPDAIAQNELSRYDNPYKKGDVRYATSFDEEIAAVKAIKYADVKNFHQAFYGANAGQFALVGDFDLAPTQTLMTALLGDWNSKQKYARVAKAYRETRSVTLSFETPDKANAFYIAVLSLPVKDDAPDAQPLALANRVLGGGGLKSRIVDRLRQKDGISYGAGSFLQMNPYEANSALGFYAIYAPQNLDKLKTGLAEEVARLLKDGVTEQELLDAKSGILQGQLINRSQDASLVGTLCSQLFQGRSMKFIADNEARLKATSLAEVNAAIVKYIDPARLVQVFAGDFANVAK
jgi:zinc protease